MSIDVKLWNVISLFTTISNLKFPPQELKKKKNGQSINMETQQLIDVETQQPIVTQCGPTYDSPQHETPLGSP